MLGILILNYNSYKICLKSVESILNSEINVEYRILILDNHSTDDSYSFLENRYKSNKNIMVKSTDFNGGFSYGNNYGIKLLRDLGCSDILISNPDIIFNKDSINILIDETKKHKNIAYAVPKIICPKDVDELYFREIMKYSFMFYDSSIFKFINKLYLKKHIDHKIDKSSVFETNMKMSGCCILLTDAFLTNVNNEVYDPDMFLYYEEDVLAIKALNEKMKGLYVGISEVEHHHDYSNRVNGFTKVQFYKSALIFAKKYRKYNKVVIFYIYLRYLIRFSLTSLIKKEYRKYIKELRKSL